MSYPHHLHDNYNTTEWLQSKIDELHEKMTNECSKALKMQASESFCEMYSIINRYFHYWEREKAYECFKLLYSNWEYLQQAYQAKWANNITDAWKISSQADNYNPYPEKDRVLQQMHKQIKWDIHLRERAVNSWLTRESVYNREYDELINTYTSLINDEPKDYSKEDLHTFKRYPRLLSVFDLIHKKDFAWIQWILHPTNKEDYIAYESIEYDYIQRLFIQSAIKTYTQDELIQLLNIIDMSLVWEWEEWYIFLDLKNQDKSFSLFRQYILSQKEQNKEILGLVQKYLYFLWRQDENSLKGIDEANVFLEGKELVIALYDFSVLQNRNTEEYVESLLLHITDPYKKCDFLLSRWLYDQCEKYIEQITDIRDKAIILMKVARRSNNFDRVYSAVSEMEGNINVKSQIISKLVELFASNWRWDDLEKRYPLLTFSWNEEENFYWKLKWYHYLLREFIEKKYNLEVLGIEPELYMQYYWNRNIRHHVYNIITDLVIAKKK